MSSREGARAVGSFAKAGFASADVGLNAVETSLRLYLLVFYTNVVGLRPALAGLAVALGLVWDALTDPWMGLLSDRTRERFGGRRFWVVIGSFLLSAALFVLFHPPPLGDDLSRFAWLLSTYALVNVGLTIMAIPHTAMSGELCSDPHERSSLMGWRFAFSNVGAIVAAALPAQMASSEEGTASARAMGEVTPWFALLLVMGAGLVWFSVRSMPPIASSRTSESFWRALFLPLRNRAFRPLLAAYVVANVGIGLNAAVALYYYGIHLELSNHEIQTLLVVFIGVFTLSIPAWVMSSRRFGKLPPLILGSCVLGLGTALLYPLLPPGNLAYPLWLGAVCLGAFVGCVVLIDSLLTDVVDLDRLHTRRVRSGIYFGLWKFAQKLSRAVALGLSGLVLEFAGFDPNAAPSGTVRVALAWLFGPGVGAFFLATGLCLLGYRFRAPEQARVQRLLARREPSNGD